MLVQLGTSGFPIAFDGDEETPGKLSAAAPLDAKASVLLKQSLRWQKLGSLTNAELHPFAFP